MLNKGGFLFLRYVDLRMNVNEMRKCDIFLFIFYLNVLGSNLCLVYGDGIKYLFMYCIYFNIL